MLASDIATRGYARAPCDFLHKNGGVSLLVQLVLEVGDLVEDDPQRLAALHEPLVNRAVFAERPLHIEVAREACQSDDFAAAPVSFRFEPSDLVRGRDTVKSRHLDVGEEEREGAVAGGEQFDGFLTILGSGERDILGMWYQRDACCKRNSANAPSRSAT